MVSLARNRPSSNSHFQGWHPNEEPQLRPLVSTRFQVLFHSPSRRSFHLSLTVLVHYRLYTVFSLGGWCRQIQTGFHRPRPTQDTTTSPSFTPTGLSPSMVLLSRQLRLRLDSDNAVLQPRTVQAPRGLGYCAFARHYLRNHCCFLLLLLLRCFSSESTPSSKGVSR